MNSRIDDLMYQAGLTAQGCWDEMDDYNREAILQFAELIIKDCAGALDPMLRDMISRGQGVHLIYKHFGLEE
jgi:hypothetical protein